jgi:hypothetical protein
MSRFDAREFLNATRARGRRKIAQAICLLAAVAGGGVLWIFMSVNSQNRLQELERFDRPEASREVSSATLRPAITPDASSARPESDDSLSDYFGSWTLRPSLEPEPTEVETAPDPQELKGSTHKGNFTARASCARDRRLLDPIT